MRTAVSRSERGSNRGSGHCGGASGNAEVVMDVLTQPSRRFPARYNAWLGWKISRFGNLLSHVAGSAAKVTDGAFPSAGVRPCGPPFVNIPSTWRKCLDGRVPAAG